MQLLCTRCGAPLPRAAANEVVTCAFCGGTEAPAPRVVESVVERVVVVEATTKNDVHCPRCGGAMQDPRIDAASALLCEHCRGLWLDPPTVERLRRQRDDDLVDAVRRATGAFAPRSRDRRPMLGCPFCGNALERHPLGGSVESYDVCPEHGAFFDYDELRTFVDAQVEQRAGTVEESDTRAAGIGGWRWPWS